MGNNKDDINRLFVFEPNPDENILIPNEDYSILIELDTYKKGRSFITGGEFQNTSSENGKVKFIAGTKVGKDKNGKPRNSLTTNYTEASTDFTVDGNTDLETFGIENIEIDFDTAYVPTIKIKFIDIRGQSIFQRGDKNGNNSSKYSIFFELPYPLFSLTVKGFYGKPVVYCLHLLKWNSSFNSSTGNFEVNAEFIGYTYAILTDMLLGLIRAVIFTDEGKPFWNDLVLEYAAAGITLKSIDEFIEDIGKLADEFKKIEQEGSSVETLNNGIKTKEAINSIENKLFTLINSITDNGENLFNDGFGVLGTTSAKKNASEKDVKSFKTEINDFLTSEEGPNKREEGTVVEIDVKAFTDNLYQLKDIPYTELSGSTTNQGTSINKLKKYIADKNPSKYSLNSDGETDTDNSNNKITNQRLFDLAETIINRLSDNTNDDVVVFDFRLAFNEIERVRKKVDDQDKKIREDIGAKLAIIAEQELDFKPTIRNVFRIFTSHCEVFMKTLKSVSDASETNTARLKVLQKVIESAKNTADNRDIAKKIFPWPEYRKKNKDGEYEETWLGEVIKSSNDFNKVNELVFTEHLLEELLKLKEKDDETIRAEERGTGPQYYPVSPLDSPILLSDEDSSFSSPYDSALLGPNNTSKPNEAIRCLLMRGFLAFGVSNKNLPKILIETMGKLEAENLFNTVVGPNSGFDTIIGRNLIKSIGAIGEDTKQNVKLVIDTAKKGYDDINNPTDKLKPLFIIEPNNSNYYKYTYIGDDNYFYLPISGGFDGKDFYDGDNIKSKNELLSIVPHFTSNVVSKSDYPNGILISQYKPREYDGSFFLKIYDSSTYENTENFINPEYGSEVLTDYNKKIGDNKLILQSSLVTTDDNSLILKHGININNIDPYSSSQKSLEISDIIYDGPTNEGENIHFTEKDKTNNESSVLSAYWHNGAFYQNNYYGTYLSTGFQENPKPDYNTFMKPEIDANGDYLFEDYLYLNNNSVLDRKDKYAIPFEFGKQRELWGNIEGGGDLTPHVPFIEFIINGRYYSLFGSKFYYTQTKIGRAFLFLHSFSWQGVIGNDNINLLEVTNDDEVITIKRLFQDNASFIKAPKLWCAFIGAILYRYDEGKENYPVDILKFDNNTLYRKDDNSKTPEYYQHLYYDEKDRSFTEELWKDEAGITLFFDSLDIVRNDTTNSYKDIDIYLARLPIQCRNEFKKIFIDFVENEFEEIQENFEIVKEYNESEWTNNFNTLSDEFVTCPTCPKDIFKEKFQYGSIDTLKSLSFKDNILETYVNVSPINKYNTTGNTSTDLIKNIEQINLTIRKDSNGSNFLNELIGDYVYILNGAPESMSISKVFNPLRGIYAKKSDMELYLTSFFNRLDVLLKTIDEKEAEEENKAKQAIFNTIDDNFIKLNLYRTLSSINNKWLGGFNKEINPNTTNVFNQCGCSGYDRTVAKNEKLKIEKLIHSFRFLDVAYNDIGDDFYLNPFSIQKIILNNYNQSFFDIANKILIDNNFNFIPLPNFINFNDINEVVDVFNPKPYGKAIKSGNQSGPSFVCIYVGQTSTSLDLGEQANYEDDGVHVKLDAFGKINPTSLPDGFTTNKKNNGDLNIPLFLVSYGLQNQSFFKDIKLDQTEFTETAESLEVIENISLSADKRKPNYNGQNLWNVYQKRSYSAEIEMMGDAMIQPFMYFQLDDIPLFRGCYNIIKVSHSISPHTMTTKFKGVRVRKTKTPLMRPETLFMNLLGTLSTYESGRNLNLTSTDIKNVISEIDIQNEDLIEERTGEVYKAKNGKLWDVLKCEKIPTTNLPVIQPRGINIVKMLIPDVLSFERKSDDAPTSIFIHHTASGGNPYSVVNYWWGSRYCKEGEHVATEFVIGGPVGTIEKQTLDNQYDGDIVQCMEPDRWAYHLGIGRNRTHRKSVGIEVCNYGRLDDNGKNDYDGIIKKDFIFTFDQSSGTRKFRGKKSYQDYSDKQIERLRQLILYIAKRDNIDPTKGLQEEILKLEDEGKWGGLAFEINDRANPPGKAAVGLWSHTNVDKQKSDMYPHPKLIKMIKELKNPN
jgi:hypothetical protein